VKWFFDSSVLVPVFVPTHPHHERSIAAFARADPRSACSAAHALAEVYATLTRLPANYGATPEQALLCLESIEERLSLVTLDVGEYRSAIRESAALGIVGGTIYDAVLGMCARKARVEVVYTWNTRHFQRLGPEIAAIARTP
jgi:predicted nucleic acid-binding protein